MIARFRGARERRERSANFVPFRTVALGQMAAIGIEEKAIDRDVRRRERAADRFR